jgi:hypothetical protein
MGAWNRPPFHSRGSLGSYLSLVLLFGNKKFITIPYESRVEKIRVTMRIMDQGGAYFVIHSFISHIKSLSPE